MPVSALFVFLFIVTPGSPTKMVIGGYPTFERRHIAEVALLAVPGLSVAAHGCYDEREGSNKLF